MNRCQRIQTLYAHLFKQGVEHIDIVKADRDLADRQRRDGGGQPQGLLRRPTKAETMGETGHQRIASTHGADHLHPRRNGLPDGIRGKPDEAISAVGDHHVGDPAGLQRAGTLGLLAQGLDGAACPLAQLLQIGFDQGRRRLDPFA